MSDIKTKVQGLDPNVRARNMDSIARKSANVYESLAIITKRARQLSVDLKHELHSKLEEFAVNSDTIEEISENKEQIEISKFYERMPKPTSLAMEEFTEGKIHHRFPSQEGAE